MTKPLPNGTANFAISGSEDLIEDAMKTLGIGRESAAIFVGKYFEHTMQSSAASEEEMQAAWNKDIQGAVVRGESWAVEYVEAYHRKLLPVWSGVVEDATAKGQDPATAVSITTNVSMEAAKVTLGLVQLWRGGASVEQVARMSVLDVQIEN